MGEEYLRDELKDEIGLHATGEKYSPEVMYWMGYLYRYWAGPAMKKAKGFIDGRRQKP